MDRQPQYCQQIQRQWRQMNGFEEQCEAQYQQEKIINNQVIHLPIDKEFMKKVRYFRLGALVFRDKMKNQCVGSGVLISKNMVLTAAHNLYEKYKKKDGKYQGQKTTGHRFYLKADGIAKTYYQIKKIFYPPQYENSKEPKYDFGLIKLGKIINPQINNQQDSNNYLKLFVPCEKCIMKKDKKLSVYGYPLYEKNYYCKDGSGVNLELFQYGYQKTDAIINCLPSQGKISYSMSTFYGHSGAPVVVDNRIIAVHVGNAKSNQNFNMGRLVTPDMIETLKEWYNQLNIDQANFFQIHQQECPHNIKKIDKVKAVKIQKPTNENINTSFQKLIVQPKQKISDNQFKSQSIFYYPSMQSTRQSLKSNQRQGLLNKSQIIKNPQIKNFSRVNMMKNSLTFNNQSSKNLSFYSISRPPTNLIMSNQQKIQLLLKQGNNMLNLQKQKEAISKFTQCLSIQEQTKGKKSSEAADTLRLLGNTYFKIKQYSHARQFYQKFIDICQQKQIVNSNYAKCLNNLGNIYSSDKNYLIAKEYYHQALKVYDHIGYRAQVNDCSQKIRLCLKYIKPDLTHKRRLSYQSIPRLPQKY